MTDALPDAFAALASAAAAERLPPVDRWDPPHCGDSLMRIRRDGSWWHDGRPIARPELVRLFSRILRREPDGSFVLVTPVEKLTIAVEDAPFVAVGMETAGADADRRLLFRLNEGSAVAAGPDRPIRIGGDGETPHPLLLVRAGLEALIARPVFYELAALAIEEGAHPPGLWSDGAFFPLDAP